MAYRNDKIAEPIYFFEELPCLFFPSSTVMCPEDKPQ
jgi:hypothetical protein